MIVTTHTPRQGIAFFLPNQTWLQPPGYVHSLVTSTWQPLALPVEVLAGKAASVSSRSRQGLVKAASVSSRSRQGLVKAASVSAQQAEDGSIVVVRLVNNAPQPLNLNVTLLDANAAPLPLSGARLAAWSLQSADVDAANTAAAPHAISPVALRLPLGPHGATVAMRAYDYTVLQFTLAG